MAGYEMDYFWETIDDLIPYRNSRRGHLVPACTTRASTSQIFVMCLSSALIRPFTSPTVEEMSISYMAGALMLRLTCVVVHHAHTHDTVLIQSERISDQSIRVECPPSESEAGVCLDGLDKVSGLPVLDGEADGGHSQVGGRGRGPVNGDLGFAPEKVDQGRLQLVFVSDD